MLVSKREGDRSSRDEIYPTYSSGLSAVLEHIRKQLPEAQRERRPLLLGIYGNANCGKTHLLEEIKRTLAEEQIAMAIEAGGPYPNTYTTIARYIRQGAHIDVHGAHFAFERRPLGRFERDEISGRAARCEVGSDAHEDLLAYRTFGVPLDIRILVRRAGELMRSDYDIVLVNELATTKARPYPA